jgi:hypothetical protein
MGRPMRGKVMRNLIVALTVLIALAAPAYAQSTRPAVFSTEQQAQSSGSHADYASAGSG